MWGAAPLDCMRTPGEGVEGEGAHMETGTGSLMSSGRDNTSQWRRGDVWAAYILRVSRRDQDSKKCHLRTAGGRERWTGSPHFLDTHQLKRAGPAEKQTTLLSRMLNLIETPYVNLQSIQ